MKAKILLVEDDLSLTELVRYNLESEGFAVLHAADGQEALLLVEEEAPDLVLLDWMLPRLSGIEVCRRLRHDPKSAHVPVIMLTARTQEGEKVRGLDSGADDYVTKPFSPRELLARINAVLRRTRPALTGTVLVYGPLRLDTATHRAWREERLLRLGPTEFRLLRHFMEHPERVFAREQLLDSVWGRDIFIEPRTVDVHIRRLRKVVNIDDEADLIRTVRAEGYSLDRHPG